MRVGQRVSYSRRSRLEMLMMVFSDAFSYLIATNKAFINFWATGPHIY